MKLMVDASTVGNQAAPPQVSDVTPGKGDEKIC